MTLGTKGQCCVIVDGGGVLARSIADALVELGTHVVVVPTDNDDPHAARDGLTRAGREIGMIGTVVYVPGGAGLTERALTGSDDARWDETCEAVLRQGLFCLQAAFETMQDRGGRIIFVVPTIAITGAAGLVPFASACEGLRGMAKSAARAWGARGITVNCVATLADVFGIEVSAGNRVPSRWPAALPPPDANDVARVVRLLTDVSAGAVTGATVAVDGGIVMAP